MACGRIGSGCGAVCSRTRSARAARRREIAARLQDGSDADPRPCTSASGIAAEGRLRPDHRHDRGLWRRSRASRDLVAAGVEATVRPEVRDTVQAIAYLIAKGADEVRQT